MGIKLNSCVKVWVLSLVHVIIFHNPINMNVIHVSVDSFEADDFWAVRNLYRAIPIVTRGVGRPNLVRQAGSS